MNRVELVKILMATLAFLLVDKLHTIENRISVIEQQQIITGKK